MTLPAIDYCNPCGRACSSDDPEVYRQATIWIAGAKSNLSALREYTGTVRCAACMRDAQAGQGAGTGTLFDDHDEPSVNMAQWHQGFEAGWRRDELVFEQEKYHHDWIAGYQAGQTARESVGDQ
jgi:hypothetical protein